MLVLDFRFTRMITQLSIESLLQEVCGLVRPYSTIPSPIRLPAKIEKPAYLPEQPGESQKPGLSFFSNLLHIPKRQGARLLN